MVEIYNSVYLGSQDDYEKFIKGRDGWMVLQACKYPYHKQAVGYINEIDESHPEYFYAHRENRLILNILDSDFEENHWDIIISYGVNFLKENFGKFKLMIHCNYGISRSSSIALLFLVEMGFLEGENFSDIEKKFKKIYPNYSPSKGINGYIKNKLYK
ncbi:MAG: dual specificity protein phosphatase family protein [Oscillospiraceae bacterium]|nr:dual specificity protein phosphatase family protein [Oscillospiraceae bacterium]